jgi:two-component system sensor histidine kinase UhpB
MTVSRKLIRPLSLRWKVTGLIVLPVLIVLAISTRFGYARQRQNALANMSLLASHTGQVIEHALERDMLVSDFERIQATVDSIARDERVRTLYLLDTDGTVIFSPKRENVGQRLDNEDPTCQPCHRSTPADRPSGILVSLVDGQQVFRSMQPIDNRPECSRCHDPEEPLIGLLLTDLSIEPVENAIALELRENLFWMVGTVVTTTLLSSFAVNRWVLQRLTKVAAAMEGIGLGGLAHRLPTEPADEVGRLGVAFNTMADRVELRDEQNTALSAALEQRAEERGLLLRRLLKAQEEERIRVARELHDELGQTLSSIALSIELSQRALAQPEIAGLAEQHLGTAHSQIAHATDHMYDLILGLRPSVLDDLGLVAALHTSSQRILEPAGIRFELVADGLEARLPANIETALFRIFQEAMTNVLKHAQAAQVQVNIEMKDDWVIGYLKDDGIGFDPSQIHPPSLIGGLGLLGMRERASQLGGTFEVSSKSRSGTRVTIRLPLDGAPDA